MPKEFGIRDAVMSAIILSLVFVQVFMVMDELTDGSLSRESSVKLTKTKARLKELIEREQYVRKNTGRVIFDAITIIDDENNGD